MEGLLSQVDQLDTCTRFAIGIAAKFASLKIRERSCLFSTTSTLNSSEDESADKNISSAAIDRIKSENAIAWLTLVCQHLDIKMTSLPDPSPSPSTSDSKEPFPDPALVESIKSAQHFDIARELILMTLRLVDQTGAKSTSTSTAAMDYSALSRSLIVSTCRQIGIELLMIEQAEKTIAQYLYFQLQSIESNQEGKVQNSNGEREAVSDEAKERASKKGNAMKWAATGAGFVLGGALIGLTGGLAAPALAPLLAGTLGMAAFSGAGGAVLIGTLLGVGGGGLASYRTHNRLKGVEEIKFEELKDKDLPRIFSLVATIVCSGFLLQESDSVDPWKKTFGENGVDAYALKADTKVFLAGGQALNTYVRDNLLRKGGEEIIKHSVLAAVYAGVALPLTVVSGAGMILDSDFSRCQDKARKAGVLLADILEKKVQGNRPVTLIGYGPGATTILHALLTLQSNGLSTLIYSAILISLPSSPSVVSWSKARQVVSSHLINCYSKNDWVLGVAARVYEIELSKGGVAGLRKVEVAGVTDCDVSDILGGHLEIRDKIGEILSRVEELGRGE